MMFHYCRITERKTNQLLPRVGKKTKQRLLSVLVTLSLFWTLWKGSWMKKSVLSTSWWFSKLQMTVSKTAIWAILKTYPQTHENIQRIWVLKEASLSAIPPKVCSPLLKSLPSTDSAQTQTLLFKEYWLLKISLYLVSLIILWIVNVLFLSTFMFLPANTFPEEAKCYFLDTDLDQQSTSWLILST